jgi:DNA-directed RNA polymerase subunit L
LLSENPNLIPDLLHSQLSFKITNTKSSFVNAIRRCISDELLIKALNTDMPNISTNDKFVLNDLIQSRLQLIPLLQDINKDVKFSLNIHNNTTHTLPVKSDLLINNDTKDKKIYFNKNIKICNLKPNTYLNMSDIYVNEDFGLSNNMYNIGRASYEVVDMDMNTVQSLSTDATNFIFYIYSNGNIETVDILLKATNTLKNRLLNISNLIENYDSSNDELIINKTDKLLSYFIKNEYHTLGNLIVDYMFDLDKNTNYLNYNNDHPSKNEITIKTDNLDNGNNLILYAIKNIIVDLENVNSMFKK